MQILHLLFRDSQDSLSPQIQQFSKASVGPDKRQGALFAFAQTALLTKGSN
jgi:hypothetical protein